MLSHIVTLSLMVCTKNGLLWSETRKTFVLEAILRNRRHECDYLMAKENKRLNLSIWYSMRNADMSLMKSWMGCIIIPVLHDILITTLFNELKIIESWEERLGHFWMVQKDHIDEWLKNHLKWYINTVEQQETESSGLISMVWIGFHLEIFQLHTLVGHKHSTPSILGHSVVNQNIDVEWLQYSLILASESGHKIIANRKMGVSIVYCKWWKYLGKYEVFHCTIYEIEEALDIMGKAFDQGEKKFTLLESLLNVPIIDCDVTIFPKYGDKDGYDKFICSPIYHFKEEKKTHYVSIAWIIHESKDRTISYSSKISWFHTSYESSQWYKEQKSC